MIELSITIGPAQDIDLQGGAGGTGPFTSSPATVTVLCKADSTAISGAVVRIFASNQPFIIPLTEAGQGFGAVLAPGMLFNVTGGAGCDGTASALDFCDITTGANGQATFTITSPSDQPTLAGAVNLQVGTHLEQVRQAFGVTLTGPGGAFNGPVTFGTIFASAPGATPELDSFVLFGAGGLALAGFAWKRRRA